MALFTVILLLQLLDLQTCCEFGLYDAFDTTGIARSRGWTVMTLSDLTGAYRHNFIQYMRAHNHRIRTIAGWIPQYCGVRSGRNIQGMNINGNGYLGIKGITKVYNAYFLPLHKRIIYLCMFI